MKAFPLTQLRKIVKLVKAKMSMGLEENTFVPVTRLKPPWSNFSSCFSWSRFSPWRSSPLSCLSMKPCQNIIMALTTLYITVKKYSDLPQFLGLFCNFLAQHGMSSTLHLKQTSPQLHH